MDPLLEAMVATGLQILVDQLAAEEQVEVARHLGSLKVGDCWDQRNQVVVAGNQVVMADRRERSSTHELDQERVQHEEEEEGIREG